MKYDTDMKARIMFVALLLTASAAGLLWYFSSLGQYTTYQIYTQDTVSGLIADAPVEFHGVEVGKVKGIRLVGPRKVAILLRIEKSAPVTSASVATIMSRGLAARGFTGYVYVALDDVGTDSQPLALQPGEPYPIIATAPSKIATLDTAIGQMKDNVQIATDLLQTLLDKNTVIALKESADNLRLASKALADNTGKLNAIVANTERASRRFGPLLDSSQDTLRTLQGATHRIEPLLDSSQDTVRAIQTQILPQAHKALADLDGLTDSLSDFATRINRDPSILIRGTSPPPPGPGERK